MNAAEGLQSVEAARRQARAAMLGSQWLTLVAVGVLVMVFGAVRLYGSTILLGVLSLLPAVGIYVGYWIAIRWRARLGLPRRGRYINFGPPSLVVLVGYALLVLWKLPAFLTVLGAPILAVGLIWLGVAERDRAVLAGTVVIALVALGSMVLSPAFHQGLTLVVFGLGMVAFALTLRQRLHRQADRLRPAPVSSPDDPT